MAGSLVLLGSWHGMAWEPPCADIFSTKRSEILQTVESELKNKLAADGIVLRSVIIGIVNDMAFAKIAARLGVHPGTLGDYARIVYKKMEVQNRKQLKARFLR